mmetsp:Transcript_1266/g.1505  ORF Transcript_1266/g.1505 Transcript_1266/m.1505 type:complete len:96 (-) Transcript_1266:418-705(-)|eukprot:CAMPEP_0170499706 /NCGR_PEP_ID=MMETSP0208-20121228/32300_1 /TAXON_ID=197538 /ORGANISM="Strombidium inclinatum, Strain S3" /LENGTH=95 /DNA_ID=CAMNT_0010777379 /DNA_START=164 /DNA_END=451 /DNA_ORIENTATION=-
MTSQFSTLKEINKMSMNPLSQPLVTAMEEDYDSNDKIDFSKIEVQFKSNPSEVRRIELYSTFDYYVEEKLKMEMKGLLHISVNCPQGASKVYSTG